MTWWPIPNNGDSAIRATETFPIGADLNPDHCVHLGNLGCTCSNLIHNVSVIGVQPIHGSVKGDGIRTAGRASAS